VNRMSEKYRLYYYMLLGALGGLTGWLVHAVIYRGVESQDWTVLLRRGAWLGTFIGISIAAYEGFASRSFVRYLKFGTYGLLLGGLAGAIALPLAQETYCRLGACVENSAAAPRYGLMISVGILCWAFFGGLIGLLEGVGKGTQFYKGFLGGVLGGVLGGAFHEPVRVLKLTTDPLTEQAFLAVTLTLLGGFVGAAIALVTNLLSEAKIEVLDGKIAGRVYDVTQYVDRKRENRTRGIIGSDKTRANIFLPGDKGILAQHAYLSYANEAPTISVSAEALKQKATVLINGRQVNSFPLSNNDVIKVGNTSMRYHQVRKAKKK
jgi:hypothetical protein